MRLVGWIEGTSWLLLFGVAMPLKYLAGQPGPVRVVGMAHGLLWLLYLAALVYTAWRLKWKPVALMVGFFASILPFGPWIFDAWRSKQEASARTN
jgi:integral membrane protein